jgi:hypothetical protein
MPKIGIATQTSSQEALLDTLVTALYVKIDDMLVKDRRPGLPVRRASPSWSVRQSRGRCWLSQ